MFIFHGDNTFESYYAAKQLLDKFANSGYRVELVDGDTVNHINELTLAHEGIDLFGQQKVMFVKRLMSNKKLAGMINSDIITAKDIVVWEDQKLDKRKAITSDILKNAKSFEFNQPKSYELAKWLSKHAKTKYQFTLDSNLSQQLIERAGENLWVLDHELAKLIIAVTNGKKLDKELIHSIVTLSKEATVWAVLDSFSKRNKIELASKLEPMLRGAEDIPYIIAMLMHELRTLAQLKYGREHNIPTGIHDFVAKKKQQYLGKYNWNELKKFYLDLLELDTDVKSGRIEPVIGLKSLLLKI